MFGLGGGFDGFHPELSPPPFVRHKRPLFPSKWLTFTK